MHRLVQDRISVLQLACLVVIKVTHWKAAKRVLRYLQGTKDHLLTFRRTDNLEVIGYSDSDFASCSDSRKSTSGYVFLLAGGAISWKSMK